jgi:flagellar basal body-associated protein FliL
LLHAPYVSNEPEKPATPAAPAPSAAKTSKVVLLLLVLNLGASGFGVFRLMTATPAAEAAPAHEHGEEEKKKEEPPSAAIVGPVLALDPFVVNLNEPASSRYMRVNIQLETSSPVAQEAVKKSILLVRDTILSHLSGLRLQDTLGAEAKERIRLELLAKLGAKIGSDKIRRILFQEFVIQ